MQRGFVFLPSDPIGFHLGARQFPAVQSFESGSDWQARSAPANEQRQLVVLSPLNRHAPVTAVDYSNPARGLNGANRNLQRVRSGSTERMILNQLKVSVAAARRFHRPAWPFAVDLPRHLPVACFEPLPKMGSPWRHNEGALQPAGGRKIGIFESAIVHQFRV